MHLEARIVISTWGQHCSQRDVTCESLVTIQAVVNHAKLPVPASLPRFLPNKSI